MKIAINERATIRRSGRVASILAVLATTATALLGPANRSRGFTICRPIHRTIAAT
jgi:hypothetical protein